MSRRSRAREVVLQVLYREDLNPQSDFDSIQDFIKGRLHEEVDLVTFALSLVTGVLRNRAELDQLLEKISGMQPAPGQDRVYYAGLIEHEEVEQRRREGIPYHREVVEWFNATANELELNFSLP